jgi:deoxyinosine 3'endonuclease (endonuclease V)
MEAGGCAFVAVDVHYLSSGGTRAAAVVAADARLSEIVAERTEVLAEVLPYRTGEFYLRELPPIRAVLHGLSELSLLVVDGYADHDPGGRAGLGAHAHAEFGVPVIGVAKTAFHTATMPCPCCAEPRQAVVRHRGWDAPRRSSRSSAPYGGTAPIARRDTPRRHTRTHGPAADRLADRQRG